MQLFLDSNQDIAPRTADHLYVIIAYEDDKKTYVMELAAVVDAEEPFVKASYNLGGDGLLILSACSTIQALALAVAQRHYLNVAGKAEELGVAPAEKAPWRKSLWMEFGPESTTFCKSSTSISTILCMRLRQLESPSHPRCNT